MKSLICLSFCVLTVFAQSESDLTPDLRFESPLSPCDVQLSEIKAGYQNALYESFTTLFRAMVDQSDAHFVFSPITIWQTLADIAEGSEGTTREELFNFLRLPEHKCIRDVYYDLSKNANSYNHYVTTLRNRAFFVDSSVAINRNWEIIVSPHRLHVINVPFKKNPVKEVEHWRNIFNAQLPNLNLDGNSLVLEFLDYEGIWKTGFSAVDILPFYNAYGDEIARIEYMKMKTTAKIAYLPAWNMKVLELPLGKDGRYKMLFGLVLGRSRSHAFRDTLDFLDSKSLYQAFRRFKPTDAQVEIQVPKFTMTSEVDVRKILEESGVRNMWVDSVGMRNISEPAAQPSAYVQRVSITMDTKGVNPNIPHYSNLVPGGPWDHNSTGVDPAIGGDFIANRPFLYGLFDTETWTCMFAASFSKP